MADVVIVLGCYVNPSGTCDLASRRRVEKALELLSEKKIDHVVFSGGINALALWKGRKTTEARAMFAYATRLGMEPRVALLEEESQSSSQNKAYCEALIDGFADSPERIWVISSDFSLHRHRSIFAGSRYEVIGVRTEPRSLAAIPESVFWILYGRLSELFKSHRPRGPTLPPSIPGVSGDLQAD